MAYYNTLKGKSAEEKLTTLLRGCGHYLFLQSGAGSTQLSILHILKSEGPMSLKDLAGKLNVKPASASELVTKLERKGMVQRQRNEEDRRKVFLCLTEKGRSVRDMKVSDKNNDYDALSEEEKNQLLSLLQKLLCSWVEDAE